MAANHPQLGAALNNIAELNRVYQEHQRESLREAEVGSRGVEKSAKDAKKRKGDQRKAPDSGKKKPKEAALEYGVDITEVDQSPELTNKYQKMKIEELKAVLRVRLARARPASSPSS